MRDLKRLLSYLGPYRKDMIIGAALIVVETFFELLIPVLMADLIDVTMMFLISGRRESRWGSAPCFL